jgi:hypothetical protein
MVLHSRRPDALLLYPMVDYPCNWNENNYVFIPVPVTITTYSRREDEDNNDYYINDFR